VTMLNGIRICGFANQWVFRKGSIRKAHTKSTKFLKENVKFPGDSIRFQQKISMLTMSYTYNTYPLTSQTIKMCVSLRNNRQLGDKVAQKWGIPFPLKYTAI
jgi:hypothetical protein